METTTVARPDELEAAGLRSGMAPRGRQPSKRGRASPLHLRFLILVLFLSCPVEALLPALDVEAAPSASSGANVTSSPGAIVATAPAPSIGASAAEVIDELGCWDTEFRLTCRELDSTIAILDARFRPSSDPEGDEGAVVEGRDPSEDPGGSTATPWPLPCPAPPPEWLQEEPWVRAVSPDGAAVVDPLSAGENESFPWPLRPDDTHRHFRLALNRRCSGVNHCSFILSNDFEEAGRLWGPGAVRIRYACMRRGRHLVRYCNEEMVAGAAPPGGWTRNQPDGGGEEAAKEEGEVLGGWEEGEGFVASPGYPKYYVAGAVGGGGGCEWLIRPRQPGQRVQLTLLDVSLRGVGPYEQECSDWLEVTAVATSSGVARKEEDERVLLTGCGEAAEAVRIESPEEAPGLRVALRSASGTLFPKRGLLFHYKALGCRWPPPRPPKDGYLVHSNASVVHYMCCVGFKFPDSGHRQRELRCDEQRGLWRVHEPIEGSELLLPDCLTDGETSLLKGNITKKLLAKFYENSTSIKKLNMKKEADLMLDILIPTIIIGVLLFGNGIIIFIIFQYKKRKISTELQEEELRIAHNGTDTTTGKPSEV